MRGSLLLFVVMSAIVVGLSMALLVFLDPRTHQYWSTRIGDFVAGVRALIGR